MTAAAGEHGPNPARAHTVHHRTAAGGAGGGAKVILGWENGGAGQYGPSQVFHIFGFPLGVVG